jgi:hypothetical protein
VHPLHKVGCRVVCRWLETERVATSPGRFGIRACSRRDDVRRTAPRTRATRPSPSESEQALFLKHEGQPIAARRAASPRLHRRVHPHDDNISDHTSSGCRPRVKSCSSAPTERTTPSFEAVGFTSVLRALFLVPAIASFGLTLRSQLLAWGTATQSQILDSYASVRMSP